MGIVKAVCISKERGTNKSPVPKGLLIADYGLESDAHAGSWHRQVSLLASESVENFQAKGYEVSPGDFGENLLVEGIELTSLPIGTRLRCHEIILEITQIGKECHSHCTIYEKVGTCIMPTKGVFAKVIHGGEIKPGDSITVEEQIRAAVLTISDRASRMERKDSSGEIAVNLLSAAGFYVVDKQILPDDITQIQEWIKTLTDEKEIPLIITTGGTGCSPRDCTPEATEPLLDRKVPGIAEAIRWESYQMTKTAALSRGISGIRKNSLIVNLPGSTKAVEEILPKVQAILRHGCEEIQRKQEVTI